MILVDTDVMVDFLRGFPAALDWFQDVRQEEILIPGFVVMELIEGCRAKSDLAPVTSAIRAMTVVWPDREACQAALGLFMESRFSHGLDAIDAMIGQLAVSLNVALYTFNDRHFAGVPNLVTRRPYSRG